MSHSPCTGREGLFFEEWREHTLIVVLVIPKFLKFVHKIIPLVARDRPSLERFVHVIQMRFGDLPMPVAIINKTRDEGRVKLLGRTKDGRGHQR